MKDSLELITDMTYMGDETGEIVVVKNGKIHIIHQLCELDGALEFYTSHGLSW